MRTLTRQIWRRTLRLVPLPPLGNNPFPQRSLSCRRFATESRLFCFLPLFRDHPATRRGIIFRLNEAARDRQESKMLNKHRSPDVAKYLLNFRPCGLNNCLPAPIDFLPFKFHLDHFEKTSTRYLLFADVKDFPPINDKISLFPGRWSSFSSP